MRIGSSAFCPARKPLSLGADASFRAMENSPPVQRPFGEPMDSPEGRLRCVWVGDPAGPELKLVKER